jgi:hypothetical protein
MADYDDNMKGVLFRTDPEKRKSDRSPDFNGHIKIDAEKFWVSGWIKTAKTTGKQFLSLSLTLAEQSDANPEERSKAADEFLKPAAANSQSAKPAAKPADDDEPPWPELPTDKPADKPLVDDEIKY